MEKKIGYIITAYFGKRDHVHEKQLHDYLFYIKIQLQQIDILNTELEKIYIVCTFDVSTNKDTVLSNLRELVGNRRNVVILDRENLGGSYCSWKHALDVDNGECDYMILEEDDYAFSNPNSIKYMLEYFEETSELFYLCQFWTDRPYKLDTIVLSNHAAMAGGMLNNKLYNELKQTGLDFELEYGVGKQSIFRNQAKFLEPYRKNGNLIKDYREKYSTIFCGDISLSIEYGNPNGDSIFLPIMNKYF